MKVLILKLGTAISEAKLANALPITTVFGSTMQELATPMMHSEMSLLLLDFFASWSLDANNDWQPPTPKPEGDFYWDEDSLSWVEYPAG